MTRNPVRAISMALVAFLSIGLMAATLTPAFAEDVNPDPAVCPTVTVEDPNTPVDESAGEPCEEPTDPTDPTDEAGEENPKGTPNDILMTMRGPNHLKIFKSLTKNSITAALNLAPKQSKNFHKTDTYAKWYAKQHIKQRYGWSKKQFGYLAKLWGKESAWKFRSLGARNYYVGIPQLHKAAILANGFSIKQFRKSPEVQIHLGSKYIKVRYGTPKQAWKHFLRRSWY